MNCNEEFITVEKLDFIDNDLILFASYQSGKFNSDNDFECKYVVNGKVCVVSFIFKFTTTLTECSVIATGLPIPSIAINFAPTLNNTNDYNTYATFRINDDGNIIEWYGFPPPINSVVKGSFTYICK